MDFPKVLIHMERLSNPTIWDIISFSILNTGEFILILLFFKDFFILDMYWQNQYKIATLNLFNDNKKVYPSGPCISL